MPSKKISSKQAQINKLALKKLRDLDLYSGDLRKKPSKHALNLIRKYDDVLKGRAKVVQPKNAAKFKGVFEVKGKNVIVPKRKGETITVDKKTGELVSKRKVGNRIVTSRGLHVKRGEKIEKPKTPKQYAIPFRKKGGGIYWQRFPTWDELQKFMAEYDYKGWQDYVVEETVGRELSNATLNKKLSEKLGRPLQTGKFKRDRAGLKRKHRTRKASRALGNI